MQRLRGWIVPGMGYAIALMVIAHHALPGGLVSPPPPPISGTAASEPPLWSFFVIWAAIPFCYQVIDRFDAWVSGKPRR